MSELPGDTAVRGAPTLGGLVRRLAPDSVARRLGAGATLFRQGDVVRDVFVVASGHLRLQRHSIEGVRLTLQMARCGDMLAEPSLFAERYHCDAVADSPSIVRVFGRKTVLDALEARRDLGRSVMAALARQVIDLRTRLELRNIRSARERVWQYLSLAADSERRMEVSGPLKDMAEALGLTPESLYRSLAHLEREGLISREPGMIRIMRGAALDVRHKPT